MKYACAFKRMQHAHACKLQLRNPDELYAGHTIDSNPVYCSLLSLSRISIFFWARACEKKRYPPRPRRSERQNREADARRYRRDERDHEKSRLDSQYPRRRLSRVGKAENLRFLENVSHCFLHKNATAVHSRRTTTYLILHFIFRLT